MRAGNQRDQRPLAARNTDPIAKHLDCLGRRSPDPDDHKSVAGVARIHDVVFRDLHDERRFKSLKLNHFSWVPASKCVKMISAGARSVTISNDPIERSCPARKRIIG
jgi:hypothetical protein